MMAKSVRETVEKVFDRLEAMSEENLVDTIDSQPKTEWSELLEEIFGEATLDDILEMQSPAGYTQTECISESSKEQGLQLIQNGDDYSVDTRHYLTINTNNLQASYEGTDLWLAKAA